MAQQGVWRSVESGEVIGEQLVASYFRVDNNTIIQYARYDNLETALAKAGLEETDEVFNFRQTDQEAKRRNLSDH